MSNITEQYGITPGPWAFEVIETGEREHSPYIQMTPRLSWPGKAYGYENYEALRAEAIANARAITEVPNMIALLEQIAEPMGNHDALGLVLAYKSLARDMITRLKP